MQSMQAKVKKSVRRKSVGCSCPTSRRSSIEGVVTRIMNGTVSSMRSQEQKTDSLSDPKNLNKVKKLNNSDESKGDDEDEDINKTKRLQFL